MTTSRGSFPANTLRGDSVTTAVAPCTPAQDLFSLLRAAFEDVCREVAEAQDRQRGKDTPAHRSAVAEARDRVDALLDMYLEIGTDARRAA